MDKLAEMVVFTEVVKRGSFSAAARALQMSPSAVSKLVTRMEERLGVRLFKRTTRKLSLSEGGEAFFARCVDILAEIEEAEERLMGYRQAPQGVLTVNSSSGFARHQLLPLVPDFLRQYPELTLNVQLTGQTVDLITENVDLAIRLGTLSDTSLVARKLGESHRIICASSDYVNKHGTPRSPADLARHNCLTLSTHEAFNQWALVTPEGRQVFSVSGNFVTDTVDALHDMVLQGLGIARLSAFMVGEDIKAGRLIPLLEEYNQEMQLIHAVYPHRRHLPAKVRVFIDFLIERFSPQPPWAV